jgi:hypothetical protein
VYFDACAKSDYGFIATTRPRYMDSTTRHNYVLQLLTSFSADGNQLDQSMKRQSVYHSVSFVTSCWS